MLRIDLVAPDGWERVNQQYREALPFQDPSVHVQIHPGYQQALWEVARGLAALFSHKKTVVIPEHAEPAIQTLAVALSEDGYTVKNLTGTELENPSTWLPSLLPDLLFALLPEDDPITGEIQRYEKFFEASKDKRVFKVILSHGAFRFQSLEKPNLYEARILSLRPDRALVVAGERCRVRPQVTPLLDWRDEKPEDIAPTLRADIDAKTIKESILSFESQLPNGFVRFFDANVDRVFDRVVFWHPKIDGYTLITELAKELNLNLPAPGQAALLETTSACRWESLRYQDWLENKGFAPEMERGLVMASVELLELPLKEKLQTVAQRILSLQG